MTLIITANISLGLELGLQIGNLSVVCEQQRVEMLLICQPAPWVAHDQKSLTRVL
jgi:hypothetical protein